LELVACEQLFYSAGSTVLRSENESSRHFHDKQPVSRVAVISDEKIHAPADQTLARQVSPSHKSARLMESTLTAAACMKRKVNADLPFHRRPRRRLRPQRRLPSSERQHWAIFQLAMSKA
jgi:hypothetical protein